MFGDNIRVFKVGGCVRDALLGIPADQIKDIDFSVEAASFSEMLSELERLGFTVFKEDPKFFTLRARFPKETKWVEWLKKSGHQPNLTADFVMCRRDGNYSDGRRPESVVAGSLMDDLARRDFTVNAIAERMNGELIDPFNGSIDAAMRQLRFVGDGEHRIAEDGLRVIRGIRFMVTKDLVPTPPTRRILQSAFAKEMLAAQQGERILDEIAKMFKFDTVRSINLLVEFGMVDTVFNKHGEFFSIWLKPTNSSRGKLRENQ